MKGFEEYTHELTDLELYTIYPMIVKGLSLRTNENPEVSSNICAGITSWLKRQKIDHKFTSPRLRKIISKIQWDNRENTSTVVSVGSKGYCMTNKISDLDANIDSLKERKNALEWKIKCLEGTRETIINNSQSKLF